MDTATQAVLAISLTRAAVHDVTQVLTLLRRTRVLGQRTGLVLYGDKAYHDKQLHAKIFGWGVKVIVEPKKNFRLGQREGFLECNLCLYKKSPWLWKHTFRFHRKAAVEHVFGMVKLKKPPLRARKPQNKHKSHLAAFLRCNLHLLFTNTQTEGT